MTTPVQKNKALVQRAIRALNEHDRTAFVDLHHLDTVLHDGDCEIHGIGAIADHEFSYFSVFPDLTLSPEILIAEDNIVAAHWTINGTHEGEFRGVDPTGSEVEFSAMGVFRIEDKRIAEVSLVSDQLRLFRQLGISEIPEK